MVQRIQELDVPAEGLSSVPTSTMEDLKHPEPDFQGFGVLTPSFVLYRQKVCI